ncbi:sigma-54 dependent transcriptional regulator [Kaistia dalseonensis]|uniref:DNA-binding transcriptional regulator NtrC n=1 Tax=Kaistia dalseonensis TaxID=410840 RepID=A0ABU0HCG0_9HYPH|nr:sigma-54 dependent transcriptional regulator [Kaistia dalseonensis]MCX5496588.1 sigma-54 dependent transcriptional regulator [Kaistia dalseonensis]MDQ0439211.1 DNA-binding NtrC family response regulator [Kaistia dalseonensis]
MSAQILIVDDDPVQRRLLEAAAVKLGHSVVTLDNGRAAINRLSATDGDRFQLMILDLVMPELDGMGVLERLPQIGRTLPVIVQTAHGGIDTVIGAIRAGACDFLVKPMSPERIQVSIENALKLSALEGELARVKHSVAGTLGFRDIITASPTMERVIRLGQRAAGSTIPILIEGESGVGKELIARAIQGSSDRRAKPFVTVNCGAIPDHLVESILFGHEKGAFTGATEKHIGKFQEAHGGTLFLDEVGELPLEAQVKLLRALQEGEIDPVGGKRPIRVDIRLISATNRDLIALVKEGRFREDLYYRLNVFPIRVPPLRERREDIPELVRHFTARFAAEEKKSGLRSVAPESLQLLTRYNWPGNIRQLENAVFRAVVLADGLQLTVDEFPQIAAQVEVGATGGESAGAAPMLLPVEAPSISLATHAPPMAGPAAGETLIRAIGDQGDVRPLADIEADMIRLAITHYRGRMATVARKLGIGRSTLYRKLKELGIAEPDEDLATE